MKILRFPFLCLVVFSLQLISCKPTPEKNKNQGLIDLVDQFLKQAETLQQQHADFQKKFSDLDQMMSTVPTAVKENIKGYDDLESRLDAIGGEKGDYRAQELGDMATQLKKFGEDLPAGKVEAVVVSQALTDMKPKLTEHQTALTELADQYKIVKKACEQVQASIPTGGKGLVLFATEPPK